MSRRGHGCVQSRHKKYLPSHHRVHSNSNAAGVYAVGETHAVQRPGEKPRCANLTMSVFKLGLLRGSSSLPGAQLPPNKDLPTLLLCSTIPSMCSQQGSSARSAKPTYSGESSHKVVNVDIWLFCVDVRPNLEEILFNRGNVFELKQNSGLKRSQVGHLGGSVNCAQLSLCL